MFSTCSYVYADKSTACVQNICLPNVCMLWVAHATGQSMRRWRLVQCCSKRSVQQTLSQFVNISNHCLVDALLHCSPDFVIHMVQIWTVRWLLFRWNKVRRVSRRKSSIVSQARCAAWVCWSSVLLKHELIPWYLPNDWQ